MLRTSPPAVNSILLALAVSLVVTGCHRSAPAPGGSEASGAVTTEIRWEERISAVRQGGSSEIRMVAQPVGADQWRALADGCENLAVLDIERSEERRVGKECRSRWSPYH